MDVEGAEGIVIEGCRTIIEKYSPWLLLEFHGFLMSEDGRKACWHKIVDSAREVMFIDGNKRYNYGSKVESMPDCLRFHVFVKY
jgi:hypothetical protein